MSSSGNIPPRDSDEALRYVRGLSPDLAPFVFSSSSTSDVSIDNHSIDNHSIGTHAVGTHAIGTHAGPQAPKPSNSDVSIENDTPPQVPEPSSNPSATNDCSNCTEERSKSRRLKRDLDDSRVEHNRLKRRCTALFRQRHALKESLEHAEDSRLAAENRSGTAEENLLAAEEQIRIAEANISTAQEELANLNQRFHQREENEYRYYNHVARRASIRANRLASEAEAIEELKNAEIEQLRRQITIQQRAWAAHVDSVESQLKEKEDDRIIEKAQCDLLLAEKDEQIALLNNRLLEEQSRNAWQNSSFNNAHTRLEAREQARQAFCRGLIDRFDGLPDSLALSDSAAVIGAREAAVQRLERLVGPIDTASEREAAILILFDRIEDLIAERNATQDRLHELQMEAADSDDELLDAED